MLKVLVVDDDKAVQMFMSQMFKKTFRLPVAIANNGKTALEICKTNFPDLICLDITMPEMDGIQFISELKKDNRFGNIEIVMMTAVNSKEAIAELLKLGVRNFILKPFEYADTQFRLKKIVLPLLENKKKERDANL